MNAMGISWRIALAPVVVLDGVWFSPSPAAPTPRPGGPGVEGHPIPSAIGGCSGFAWVCGPHQATDTLLAMVILAAKARQGTIPVGGTSGTSAP